MFKKIFILSILTFCFLINLPATDSYAEFGLKGTVYLKINIHYQDNGRECKASYANFTNPGTGHKILPLNTPVNIEKWGRKGFIIVNKSDKKEIHFEFHKQRMQMSIEKYLKTITSPSKISIDGLSENDKKGIQKGKAYKGMTKNGVMMALGYPATHRTPSLKSDKWTYWTNRFGTIVVQFDGKGIVTNVVD